MGMPTINIMFIEKAKTALKRSERGVVGLILRDELLPAKNPLALTNEEDIPETVSPENRGELERALIGNVTPPTKVVAYFILEESGELQEALDYFELAKVNYLAVPGISQEGDMEKVSSWVKKVRKNGRMVKAVLPNHEADHEAIINYATPSVTTQSGDLTAKQFCGRIAGICAGTPLTQAITYAKLPEATDCARMTKEEMDAAVDEGKLIVFYDGESVKVARGVNSLQTTTPEKGDQFKKIKILDVMDTMEDDITTCIKEQYIGKYTNSYDHKCLLVSSVGVYLERLVKDQILDHAQVEIDIEETKKYLESQKIDTSEMDLETIKRHPTDEKVFLVVQTKILDAMEDVSIKIEV